MGGIITCSRQPDTTGQGAIPAAPQATAVSLLQKLLAMEMLSFLLMNWKGRFAAQAGHMRKESPDRPDSGCPRVVTVAAQAVLSAMIARDLIASLSKA